MLENKLFLDTINKFGTCLFVKIDSIINNYNHLVKLAAGAEMSWVIKSDAYGLGIENIIPLIKKVRCNHIFVATLREAMGVRSFYQDDNSVNIYVLNPILSAQYEEIYNNKFIPVLNTLTQVKLWSEFATSKNQKLKCILHIETGINRFAIMKDEILYLYQQPQILDKVEILYIMSHFSSASIKSKDIVEKQYEEFKSLIKYLPKSKYSIAASDGLFIDSKYAMDLVRPAIVLYGGLVADLAHNSMEKVIYLYSTVQQIKELKAGEKVGYGHLWEAKIPSKIAVLPIGYADGVLRSMNHRGVVYIDGYSAPIIGCISMDLITVDITKLPQNLQKEGQIVELIGDNISLEDFAINAKTIDTEILVSLTRRYPRIYR